MRPSRPRPSRPAPQKDAGIGHDAGARGVADKGAAPSGATAAARQPDATGGQAAVPAHPRDTGLDWARWRVVTGEDRGDGWAYGTCPRCHAEGDTDALPTLMAHLPSGRFFCASCGHHGDASLAPSQYRRPRVDLSVPWWQEQDTTQVEQWMAHALGEGVPDGLGIGLDRALVGQENGLAWDPALVFPCRLKPEAPLSAVMFLPVDEDGQFLDFQDLPGTEAAPWGWDTVHGDTVVFVNHPLDRIALMMAGVESVVCVPPRMNPLLPGGGDWSTLSAIEKDLAGVGKVVMAMRQDDAGRKLEEELARRVGKDRCLRVRWQNYRVEDDTTSAQSVLADQGPQVLAEAVANAPAFPVAGVHELYEVEDSFDILYEFGLQPGVSTGWPTLDLNYTVKPGQWTVVTGIPGHGKSTLVDALLVNLANLHGWKFGVFSPENQPVERHYASLMEKAAGQPFSEGPHPRISPQRKNELKGWLNEHFKIILPDEGDDGDWSVDHILALGRTLVYRHGIKGLVIDPWNELTHMRPPHVNEADYVAMELTKIRRFARVYGVHVWVVVHPNKLEKGPDNKYAVVTPYMLAGGANWRNKADNILSVYRNLMQADQDVMDIYTQKVRFKEVGCLGRASLRGDPMCGRYIDDIEQAKRELSLRSPTPMPTQQLRIPTERKVRGAPMAIEPCPAPLPSTYSR